MRLPELLTADEALRFLKGYPTRKEDDTDEQFMSRVYEARRTLRKKVISSGGKVSRPLGKDVYRVEDLKELLENTAIAA